MEKKLDIITDIDPKKISTFGKLPNNFDSLENSDFVTEEGVKMDFEIFKVLIHDNALKHWDIKPYK